MVAPKAERLRFYGEHDIILLQEVLRLNPFEDSSRWKTVHKYVVEACDRQFTIRSVREHLEHIIKLYMKEDWRNLKKSGTEKQYEEKQMLLRQVTEMRQEFHKRKKYDGDRSDTLLKEISANSTSSQVSYVVCENTEDEELYNWQEYDVKPQINSPSHSNESSDPLILAVPTSSTTEFIKDFSKEKKTLANFKERELQLEERKLQLEERRIALEEERFKLEKAERERRLETELKERDVFVKIFQQQQQQFMSYFLKQNPNNAQN